MESCTECGGCPSRGCQAWASLTAGMWGAGRASACIAHIHWFLKMFWSSRLSWDGKAQHTLSDLFLRHRKKEGFPGGGGGALREKDSGRRGLEPQQKGFLHPSVWGLPHSLAFRARAPASPVLTLPPASPEGEPGSVCTDTGKGRG